MVLVMAYDYSYQGGPPGPIDPRWWVRQVLAFAAHSIPLAKLQVGLPAYACDWVTTAPYLSTNLTLPKSIRSADGVRTSSPGGTRQRRSRISPTRSERSNTTCPLRTRPALPMCLRRPEPSTCLRASTGTRAARTRPCRANWRPTTPDGSRCGRSHVSEALLPPCRAIRRPTPRSTRWNPCEPCGLSFGTEPSDALIALPRLLEDGHRLFPIQP